MFEFKYLHDKGGGQGGITECGGGKNWVQTNWALAEAECLDGETNAMHGVRCIPTIVWFRLLPVAKQLADYKVPFHTAPSYSISLLQDNDAPFHFLTSHVLNVNV